MSILSIQSHVAYGYVGNKAAVYPLQYMGHDVWPIHTVQFSNHTGYGKWQGDIFSAEHIKSIVQGLQDIKQMHKCQAVLSGYMGSAAICEAVRSIVHQLKAQNPKVLYLCDPVIGNNSCYVKPEVLKFFEQYLAADIITPNQYEAEVLSKIKITDIESLKRVTSYFHAKNVKIVVITGLNLLERPNSLCIFVSDSAAQYLIETTEYHFPTPINGTGDLFSALYLGYYLTTKDIFLSLQNTAYYIQEVLHNTYKSQETELQVLSARYDRVNKESLPSLIKI